MIKIPAGGQEKGTQAPEHTKPLAGGKGTRRRVSVDESMYGLHIPQSMSVQLPIRGAWKRWHDLQLTWTLRGSEPAPGELE